MLSFSPPPPKYLSQPLQITFSKVGVNKTVSTGKIGINKVALQPIFVNHNRCEKGLEANKQLAVCLNDEQKKLMNGVGYSVKDKSERLVMECSGEIDGEHTEEDTLKLMEATSRCLKSEMGRYQSSSWITFGCRKVLAIQVINNTITLLSTKRIEGNKWVFVEQRSALVPRDWEDRLYWVEVFELLMKLNELHAEQEEVTEKLKRERVGLAKVEAKDTIKRALFNIEND